jgi:hypothetical protein
MRKRKTSIENLAATGLPTRSRSRKTLNPRELTNKVKTKSMLSSIQQRGLQIDYRWIDCTKTCKKFTANFTNRLDSDDAF